MPTIEEQFEQGLSALSSGDIDTAIREFESVVSGNHEKWVAWRGLGQAYHQKGEFQKSIDSFAKATLIRPDDVESHYGHGLAFQAIEDHAHAIRAFEEALYRDHQHRPSQQAVVESLLARAEAMRGIRNLLAVEEYLEKAHKFDPTNVSITAELLGYYADTDQAFKADTLRKELTAHGLPVPEAATHAEEKSTKVVLTADMGADALRAALAIDHENWNGWRALGDAELANGQYEEAKEAYKKATVIRFDDADSQYGFGLALQQLGDHGHAIPPFVEAISHDPDHDKAKTALAISLLARVDEMERIGNLLAVEQYLEKAHKFDPDNDSAREKLMAYYRQTGQGNKADSLSREGVQPSASAPVTEYSTASSFGDDVLLAAERHGEEPRPLDSIASGRAHTPAAPSSHDPILHASGSLQSPPTAKAPTNVTQMLPCPACKQPMPSIARICVHCSARVDPIQGVQLGVNPRAMGLSTGEKAYKIVSWLLLLFGLGLTAASFLMIDAAKTLASTDPLEQVVADSAHTSGVVFGILAALNLAFALGLLFEIEWSQFVIYWGSFLLLLGGVMVFFFFGVFAASPIGMIVGLFSIGFHGATMWAIKQVGDV